jgi:hypothetical protein
MKDSQDNEAVWFGFEIRISKGKSPHPQPHRRKGLALYNDKKVIGCKWDKAFHVGLHWY